MWSNLFPFWGKGRASLHYCATKIHLDYSKDLKKDLMSKEKMVKKPAPNSFHDINQKAFIFMFIIFLMRQNKNNIYFTGKIGS